MIWKYRIPFLHAGTEEDQAVGMGIDQAPFQSGPDTGTADDDTYVRRVTEINNVQYWKGPIQSEEGVAGYNDLRCGFNLVKVNIESN